AIETWITALDREQAQVTERERAKERRRRLGGVVGALVMLLGYSSVLAVITRPILVASLFDSRSLGENLMRGWTISLIIANGLPDLFRGLVLAGLGSLSALVIGGLSPRLQWDVGGGLLMGGAALGLLGFATAASTGLLGVLVAGPGLLATTALV